MVMKKLIEFFDKIWLTPNESDKDSFKLKINPMINSIYKQGNVIGLINKNFHEMEFGLHTFEGRSEQECWDNIEKHCYSLLLYGVNEFLEPKEGIQFDCENSSFGIQFKFEVQTFLCLYLAKSFFDSAVNKWYIKCSPVCLDSNRYKIFVKEK